MKSQRFAILSVTSATVALAVLAATGCNNSSTGSVPPPPPSSSGAMFITDFTNNSVLVFGQNANCGSCNQARLVQGASTLINHPIGIAVDNSGTMYVASSGNANVLEFPANGKGNIAPTFRINGVFNTPSGVAVDAARNVYVTDTNLNNVQIFAPGSSVPTATIAGNLTQLNVPDFIALDGANDIWVANQNGNSVIEFPPLTSNPNGNIAPMQVISGANTLITSPQGIAFDSHGRLWVVINTGIGNSDAVLLFQGTLNGNIAPANAICGPATGVNNPTGVAVNSQGTVFVTNSFFGSPGYITDFASNNIGNLNCTGPLPNASVAGPSMLNPVGIALH